MTRIGFIAEVASVALINFGAVIWKRSGSFLNKHVKHSE